MESNKEILNHPGHLENLARSGLYIMRNDIVVGLGREITAGKKLKSEVEGEKIASKTGFYLVIFIARRAAYIYVR